MACGAAAAMLRIPLGGLALLSILAGTTRAQVDSDASSFVISYGRDGSVGPDGPWWYIPLAIDYPDQWMQMLPSLSELSLVVNKDACDDSTTCPLPLPNMWRRSGAWDVSGGNVTISDDVDAQTWDSELTGLSGVEGRGRFFQDRVTLHNDGNLDNAFYMEGTGMMLSDSYDVTYPGGQRYTMNTGFFSLYAGEQNVSWSAENGTNVQSNRTLPLAYENGYIQSMSYGLHVGSANLNVSGSLVLGGYDSSRMLSDPIVSEEETFTLNAIGIDSVGGYMYYGDPSPNDNLLTTPGMDVKIDPGAPYMYLPRQTCDAIADFLPVKYNEDFNLYLWDKSDSAFYDIVHSLHFMSLGFASSNNRTQKINVPFALLNLTLESPLVSEPTPYFPCSPLKTGQTATLGRAFLQAAFLAQNWQTERIYLAQAPGPDGQPEYIRDIASDDTQLMPATNPPSWQATWASKLPPWDDSNEPDGSGGGLSGGAIAGIVVGIITIVVILAGLALWFFRRRKRRQSFVKPGDSIHAPVELAAGQGSRGAYQEGSRYAYYKEAEIYEAEANGPRQEMDGNQTIVELAATEQGAPRDSWKR